MDKDGTLKIDYGEWRDYLLLSPSNNFNDILHYWRHSTVSHLPLFSVWFFLLARSIILWQKCCNCWCFLRYGTKDLSLFFCFVPSAQKNVFLVLSCLRKYIFFRILKTSWTIFCFVFDSTTEKGFDDLFGITTCVLYYHVF